MQNNKDISCVDFAKQIAPFLKTIQVRFKGPSWWWEVPDAMFYAMCKILEFCSGKHTEPARDPRRSNEELALSIAELIGQSLFGSCEYAGSPHYPFVVEITKVDCMACRLEEQEFPSEIRMKEEMFKKVLNTAVNDGMTVLVMYYGEVASFRGISWKQETCNPDFEEIVAKKLWEEISSGIKDGTKVNVLGRVAIRKNDGMYYLERGPAIWPT